MRALTTKSPCTLSSYFRSYLHYNPKKNLSALKLSKRLETPLEDLDRVCGGNSGLSNKLDSPQVKKLVNEGVDDEEKEKCVLDIPDSSHGYFPMSQKEAWRQMKQNRIFKDTKGYDEFLDMFARKLGPTSKIDVFDCLGRETGPKKYNVLIKLCIEKARATNDENISIEEMSKIYRLLKLMRECGFQIEEDTCHQLFEYVIHKGFVHEFQLFYDVIKAGNPSSISRLGYYEMLLWIRVNNEEMIRDICEFIKVEESNDTSALRESYLLALCGSDRKTQILDVLKNIDITKLTSAKSISHIFQSMGRLLLELEAENLLSDLRACGHSADKISNYIAGYAVSTPNLAVEDMISKVENLHDEMEVLPSSSTYQKLIFYCCDMRKVDVALDIVDKMCERGFKLPTHVLQSILHICEETYDYILVHRIYSIISRHHHHLELNDDICRCLVHFCVQIKDFERAYEMVDELQEMGYKPTTAMYNAIMAGYFREKYISCGFRVLKHMQQANVKPDSQTFSYLISNCETKDDITMYYEELKQSEVRPTKQIFMALINAYAACGELEKAKQVLLDPRIHRKSLNEIKSVLVSALASHGQLSEALVIKEQIKGDAFQSLSRSSILIVR